MSKLKTIIQKFIKLLYTITMYALVIRLRFDYENFKGLIVTLKGYDTYFWLDQMWDGVILSEKFPRLFRLEANKNVTAREMCDNRQFREIF